MNYSYKVVSVEPGSGEIVESETMSYAAACKLKAELVERDPDSHHEVVRVGDE